MQYTSNGPARALRTLAPLLLTTLAQAGTIIVDQNGGVGADFTTLQDAVDAAQDGDIIFVRAGAYAGTTISGKRLTLIGDPGQTGCSSLLIDSITPARPVTVVGISSTFDVRNSTGLVLLDRVLPAVAAPFQSRLTGQSVSDLRIQGSEFRGIGAFDQYDEPTAAITLGELPGNPVRLELLRSTVLGGFGFTGFGYDWGGNGSDGITGFEGSMHVALSTVDGGKGGDYLGTDQSPYPGDGGNAVTLLGTVEGRFVGPGLALSPGPGGFDAETKDFGADGLAIAAAPGATALVDALDPSLEILGDPQLGAPTTWRAWAAPGAAVDLHLGTRPQLLDDGVAAVELLVKPARTFALGIVPASGFVDFTLPPVPQLGLGAMVIGQAQVDLGAGDVRRSNSAIAVMITPVP